MTAVFFTLIGVLTIAWGIVTGVAGQTVMHQIHSQLVTLTGVVCIAVAVLGDIARKVGKR